MFDIIHDWKNGPKCKKLIRNLQCRLKILKSKRSYKVKELRENISQLLHHGFVPHAFDKAEKLFKYEHEVIIYDLLDRVCKFVINFSYITKYNDSPNVIDQAVSTLIFSSSRLRNLPELVQLRKLFRKLYGERFANVAIELLPGNLVNQQIIDCITIISEPVSVKMTFRVMNEIAKNCQKSRPLLIDHPAAESRHEGDKTSEGETLYLDIEDEDFSSESQSCIKKSVHSSCSSCSISTSSTCFESVESLTVTREVKELEFEDRFDFSDCEFINLVPRTSSIPFENQIDGVQEIGFSMADESSSESSAAFSYEIIYSDGIEEYESVGNVEGSFQDQRVSKFPLTSMSRKKLSERSMSVEKGCMLDLESVISYGVESCDSDNRNYINRQFKSTKFDKCSEENQCYLCKSKGVDYSIYLYLESLSPEDKEGLIQDGLICMRALSMPPERLEKFENSGDKYHKEHCKKKHLSRESRKLRTSSVSVEKFCMIDSESATYNGMDPYEISQNKQCVDEEHEFTFPIMTSPCHVHPKFPDYDDLTTRFFALKEAYLECKE